MPGRKYNSAEYRYGFNGKEKDDEGEFGSITNYDYGFRIYNPAVARFLSVDPLTQSYPWYTPYQFAGNGPIMNIDVDGLEPTSSTRTVEGEPDAVETNIDEDWVVVTAKGNGLETKEKTSHPKLLYNRFNHWRPRGDGLGLSVDKHIARQKTPFTEGLKNITAGGLAIGFIPAGMASLSAAGIAESVSINYAADYLGHVFAGDGLLGSFSKLDHSDNFLPSHKLSWFIGAAVDFGQKKDGSYGFSSVFDGSKSLSHGITDLGFNALFGSYDAGLTKSMSEVESFLKNLASKADSKAFGLLRNIDSFRPKIGVTRYTKFLGQAQEASVLASKYGSRAANRRLFFGISTLGTGVRQETAKDITKKIAP